MINPYTIAYAAVERGVSVTVRHCIRSVRVPTYTVVLVVQYYMGGWLLQV